MRRLLTPRPHGGWIVRTMTGNREASAFADTNPHNECGTMLSVTARPLSRRKGNRSSDKCTAASGK